MNSHDARAFLINSREQVKTDPDATQRDFEALSPADKFALSTEALVEVGHALVHALLDVVGELPEDKAVALSMVAADYHEGFTLRRQAAERLEDVAK